MSLRAYFDSAQTENRTDKTAQQQRTMTHGVTIKSGAEAQRHLKYGQDSLKKLRAHQNQLKKKQHS